MEEKAVDEYLERILRPQLVSFRPGEPTVMEGTSSLRVDRFGDEADDALAEPWALHPLRIELTLSPEAEGFIRRSPLLDVTDETALQDVYMSVPRSALLRRRRIRFTRR
jgi:hypothetical protein